MEALLTSVGSVFTSAVGWVGTVASTITGQPTAEVKTEPTEVSRASIVQHPFIYVFACLNRESE